MTNDNLSNAGDLEKEPTVPVKEAVELEVRAGQESWIRLLASSLFKSAIIFSVILNVAYFLGNLPAQSPSFSTVFESWVISLGLIIVTIIALGISFWNYHIRYIYLKDSQALVPEKWGRLIDRLAHQAELLKAESSSSLTEIKELSANHSSNSESLLESFLTLQKALDNKDKEIARLKTGYDAAIFKKFLLRFIRLDRALDSLISECTDDQQKKNYKYLSRILDDALEECGVVVFTPNEGSDYRDVDANVDDSPKIIPTSDAKKDFKIAEILSPGYVLEGEENEVVVPCKIAIFRFSESNEGKEI